MAQIGNVSVSIIYGDFRQLLIATSMQAHIIHGGYRSCVDLAADSIDVADAVIKLLESEATDAAPE